MAGLRLDFCGARQHVMSRGVRRGLTFTSELSRQHFLERLSLLPERHGVAILAYVLMGNHYHLLVQSHRGNLGVAMQDLLGSYGRWFARHTGWEGAVFSGRYRNRVAEHDEDWLHLLAYLHLNPVRAGIVRSARNYRWSSIQAYLDPGARPEWLTCEPFLALYGGAQAHLDYMDDVVAGRRREPEGWRDRALWAPGATGRLLPGLEARRLPEVVSDLQQALGVEWSEIQGPSGGPGDDLRLVASWWAYRSTELSLRGLAPELGISRSALAKRIQVVESLRGGGGEVDRAVEHLLATRVKPAA